MDPSGGIPAPGLDPDDWSIRWTATFMAPADGDYTFHLTNQARAKLFLDRSTLIDIQAWWCPEGPRIVRPAV